MVQNLDSLVRRALLGSFFVLCTYSAFARTSRAVAQDEFPRAAYTTNPQTADPGVRPVIDVRYAVPQHRADYFWGHRRHRSAFDRWFYVRQAVIRLHNNPPLMTEIPRLGRYHVLYPAYPPNREARAVRVDTTQGYSVPGVVSLRSNGGN